MKVQTLMTDILQLRGCPNQPAEQGLILDQRHPVVRVIGTLFHSKLAQARLSAQQDDVGLRLCRHETKQEDVRAFAGVTLQICILQLGLRVQRDFLVLRLDQV